MNAERRARLKAIVDRIVDEILPEAEAVKEEEEAAFEAMPESIQGGKAGERSTEWQSAIDDMIGGLEQARDAIGELTVE